MDNAMDKKNVYQIAYLHRRQASGLCIRCGKPMDRKGALCTSCLAKDREYYQQMKEYLEERGICTTCHKRKTDGHKTCPECRAKANERSHAYYARKKMRTRAGDADG